MTYKIGFDIGSTTIKAVVLDENQQICYKSYERHKAQVRQKALEKIKELERYTKEPFQFAISGSGALGLCDDGKLPFVQEVFASATAIRKYYPDTEYPSDMVDFNESQGRTPYGKSLNNILMDCDEFNLFYRVYKDLLNI